MSEAIRKALTARQWQALEFIQDSIVGDGYPPTLREIGAHMDIGSTNGVVDHLKALVKKGYLERDPAKSRAMRTIDFDDALDAWSL